ncbi:HTH-type transcriptional repressor CytR [bioreactor metagenome]|uniref:HTH-type transcriptional repressor CytR n=2 Tax=root TaxID=1 RepID=A0A645AV67_9ZZZZ
MQPHLQQQLLPRWGYATLTTRTSAPLRSVHGRVRLMTSTARLVAQRAGVSVSTVSRAYTHPDKLSPATLSRVREAAQALDYEPVQVRRPYGIGTSHPTIAFIAPDIANPYFAAIAKAAQQRAHMRSFNMMVANTSEDIEQESELLNGLPPSVQGVISCSSRSTDSQILEMSARAPMVLINHSVPSVNSVRVDETDAMRQIVNHLTALGHRRIAYAGGSAASPSEVARSSALIQIDAEHDELEIMHLGNFAAFAHGGMAAADLVISSGATAVIAFNDLAAIGILSRLHQRGLRVPEDISVVGTDDVLISEATYPPLTTMAMPLERLGSAAVELLEKAISGQSIMREEVVLLASLVIRQSTGPAPSNHDASAS